MSWFKRKTDLQRGNELLAKGDAESALQAFVRHARKDLSDRADALARAAKCCLRINRLKSPVEIEPGVTLVSEGDVANAMIFYQQALESDPEHIESLIGVADTLDRGPERVNFLRRILAKQPRARTYVDLGEELLQIDEFQEAQACFEEAVSGAPRDRTAYDRLIELHTTQGKVEEANQWRARWQAVNAKRRRVSPAR